MIIILVSLITSLAYGNPCTHKNLITEPNSPFNKIPVYDQDGVNICYAYAASQLVDYKLIKEGASERNVHPAWLALINSTKTGRDELSFGNTRDTLNQLGSEYNCHYGTVEKELSNWAREAKVTEAEVLSFIEIFSKKYKKNKNVTLAFQDTLKASELNCPPHATWQNILPEIESLMAVTSTQIVSGLLMPNCSGSKQKVRLKTELVNNLSPSFMSKNIMKHLDSPEIPVEIAYCMNMWKDPSYVGRSGPAHNDFKKDCLFHSSIVVGKKLVNNSCQLLVRNTVGNGWSRSNEKWKCLCKSKITGKFVDDCTYQTHNNGEYSVEACWVNEEVLNKNIHSSTIIK